MECPTQRELIGTLTSLRLAAHHATGRRAVPPHANCVEGHALISEAWFEGKGCFLSQAAASVLCEHIEGQSLDGLHDFAAAEMLSLLGIPLTPRRQQCGLLAFQALKKLRDGPPPVAG